MLPSAIPADRRGNTLKMRRRLAAVVAVVSVRTLLVRTADFQAFISAYPEVLDLIEEQIFTRTQGYHPGPTWPGRTARLSAPTRWTSPRRTATSRTSIPTVSVLAWLTTAFPPRLRTHNRIHREPVQITLQVAVEVGPVKKDRSGMSGDAIINVSRMVDTPAFRHAMAE